MNDRLSFYFYKKNIKADSLVNMRVASLLFMFLDAILCLKNIEYECRPSYSGTDEDGNTEHMETDPTRFYSKSDPRSNMQYGVPDRSFVQFPDTPSILDIENERMHDDCQTTQSPYLYQSSDRIPKRKPKHCPQPIPFCQQQQKSPAFCLPPLSVPPCSHLQDTLMNVNTYFHSVLQKADNEYIKLVEAFTRDFAQVILEAKKNLSIKITLDKEDLVSLITSALTNTSSEDLDLVVSAVNKENAALDTQVSSLKAIAEEKIIKILNALAEQTDPAIIASATNLSTFSGLLLQLLDVLNILGNELGQVLSQSTDNLNFALNEIFGCENAQGFRQISDALSNNNTAQLTVLLSKSKNVNNKINEVILQFVKDVSALYYKLFTNLGQYNVKAVRDLCNRLELSSINPTQSQNAIGSGLCSQSTFSPFGSVTR